MDTVFLGVIAVSVAVMAVMQVAVLVYTARLVRRIEKLTGDVEQKLQPLIDGLQGVVSEAARAATLASAQVDRLDHLITSLSARVEEAAEYVQSRVLAPLREGGALLAGLRAALAALRSGSTRRRSRPSQADDEDSLFIG
ncbi:MAG: hypothetical protein FJW23_05785 [Acidimicrobiia bacterium]|nr:hypothetical protein [Acidimicrobiia bacterium]